MADLAMLLSSTHPVYDNWSERWGRAERRLRGGDAVLPELARFEWEGDEHYEARQLQATYVNFPELHATVMAGHLLREAPQPGHGLDFGTLGVVDRRAGQPEASRAELVYFNVDGTGSDGAQWDAWWDSVDKRAQATGHRWIMCEASQDAPRTRADEATGRRPYLVEYSPLDVTNWHFERGVLQWAILRPAIRDLGVDGSGSGQYRQGFLLLVRAGYAGLGPELAGGGWWSFDYEKKPLQNGDWQKTRGEIPLWPYFYERDPSEGSSTDPSMSRPALTALGQIAVSYMNLSSAADFDAWDAAKSIKYLLGADANVHKTVKQQLEGGSQVVSVPLAHDGSTVTLVDGSSGAVAAEVFEKRLANKWMEARESSAREATSTPNSSGASKVAGFADVKAPRLAAMAANREQAQNTAIHFLELRFGAVTPTGSVAWQRDFDLSDLISDIEEHFALEKMTGYRSKTLGASLMVQAAREKGLVTDDKVAKTVEDEYSASAETAGRQQTQTTSLFGDFGLPPT